MVVGDFERDEFDTSDPNLNSPTDFTVHHLKYQQLQQQSQQLQQHLESQQLKRSAYVTMCGYNNAVFAIADLNGVGMRGKILHVSFKRDNNIINGYNNAAIAYNNPTECLNNQVEDLNNSIDYYSNAGGVYNNGRVCYNSGRSNSSNGSVNNSLTSLSNYNNGDGNHVKAYNGDVSYKTNASCFYGNHFQEANNLYNNIQNVE